MPDAQVIRFPVERRELGTVAPSGNVVLTSLRRPGPAAELPASKVGRGPLFTRARVLLWLAMVAWCGAMWGITWVLAGGRP